MAASASLGRLDLPRRREDLQIVRQQHGKTPYWAIKDPVAGTFFLLGEEEFAIFEMLDGHHSLRQITNQLALRFAPRRITEQRCFDFLGRLHRDGLVITAAVGQGELLEERAEKHRRHRRWARWLNCLAIRWQGWNPDPFLTWLHARLKWVFHPLCFASGVALMCLAGLLVTLNLESAWHRWPEFHELFTLSNAGWLVVVFVVVKLIHELAHGLTCKHFGGECTELGVLFLAFVPCLYCDVSDSWMMPKRWQRIAVAAAGMYVECLLAAVAACGWWITAPGPLHATFRNIMMVCGVTTLIVNANPLMRFDGYFILSDLLGVPNLHARSRAVLRRWWYHWGLGVPLRPSRALPERFQAWLGLFAVASTAYRAIVLIAILWLVQSVLTPYRLGAIVPLIVLLVLAGMLIPAMLQLWRFTQQPGMASRIRLPNVMATVLVLFLALGAVCFVPLPCRVRTNAEVRARDAQIVYASAPGTLIDAVAVGTVVKQGQTIAKLKNHQIDFLVAQAEGETRQQQLHVDQLRAQRVFDDFARRELPWAEERLADLQARLETLHREAGRLTLRAPRSGIVFSSDPIARHAAHRPSPLAPENRNQFVPPQTPICMVGDARRDAVLAVNQDFLRLIRVGQHVRIRLGGATVSGTVREISERGVKVTSRELLGNPRLRRWGNASRPNPTLFEARVELSGNGSDLPIGLHGRARVQVSALTLRERLANYFFHSFHRTS